MSQTKLFTPVKVGDVTLQHRIVLAPLTRERANKHHVPTPMMVEYYAQRASSPGTMLISEATLIAPRAGGRANTPGLWNEEQVSRWQQVRTSRSASSTPMFSLPTTTFRSPAQFTLKGHTSTRSYGPWVEWLDPRCCKLKEIIHMFPPPTSFCRASRSLPVH